jgi:hypothetical protein
MQPMQAQEFLTAVRDQVIAALPESLRDLRSRIRYGMLQMHYAEPATHYEVWLVRKTGRIEIGLHFEGGRESNHRRAAELADRALELRESLGPEVELEEWSPSWTRLHVTIPLLELDAGLATQVSDRLASFVRLTGESVRNSLPGTPAPSPTARTERGRHWRGRHGGTTHLIR